MKKYLVLFQSHLSIEEQMKASHEDMQKGMDLWVKWFEAHRQSIVDHGAPLGDETTITKKGSSRPTTFIGGYSILQGDTSDAVKAMLADHPHFMVEGNSIEVLEVLPTPGM